MPATAWSRSTPRTPVPASDVVAAIGNWTDTPVTHLVYTHGHADHVGGSPDFAAAYGDMNVIGHRNVETRFDRYAYTNDWNVLINARQFGGVRGDFGMGGEAPDFIPTTTLRPDHVVDAHDHIMVGDRTIEFHHARGETDDHLWGWMPEEKWLFTGDFVIWNFPNAGNPQKVQRFPIEWAAALREMIAREPELLLPAHGLPIEGTRADRSGARRHRRCARASRVGRGRHDERGGGARHDRPQRARAGRRARQAVPSSAVRRARIRGAQHLAPVRWLVGRRAQPLEAVARCRRWLSSSPTWPGERPC